MRLVIQDQITGENGCFEGHSSANPVGLVKIVDHNRLFSRLPSFKPSHELPSNKVRVFQRFGIKKKFVVRNDSELFENIRFRNCGKPCKGVGFHFWGFGVSSLWVRTGRKDPGGGGGRAGRRHRDTGRASSS